MPINTCCCGMQNCNHCRWQLNNYNGQIITCIDDFDINTWEFSGTCLILDPVIRTSDGMGGVSPPLAYEWAGQFGSILLDSVQPNWGESYLSGCVKDSMPLPASLCGWEISATQQFNLFGPWVTPPDVSGVPQLQYGMGGFRCVVNGTTMVPYGMSGGYGAGPIIGNWTICTADSPDAALEVPPNANATGVNTGFDGGTAGMAGDYEKTGRQNQSNIDTVNIIICGVEDRRENFSGLNARLNYVVYGSLTDTLTPMSGFEENGDRESLVFPASGSGGPLVLPVFIEDELDPTTLGIRSSVDDAGFTAKTNASWITVAGSGIGAGFISDLIAADTSRVWWYTAIAPPAGIYHPPTDFTAGTGSPVTITVAANTGGCPRSALVWISFRPRQVGPIGTGILYCSAIHIYQRGASDAVCVLDGINSISPTTQSVPAGGGSYTTTLTVATGYESCTWYVSGVPSWITGLADHYVGNAAPGYSVAPTTEDVDRIVDIYFGSKSEKITQTGATFAISETTHEFCFASDTGTVDLTTNSTNALWTAASDSGWLTITSVTSGAGNQTLAYSLSDNYDWADRVGVIIIKGNSGTERARLTVTQHYIYVDDTYFWLDAGTGSASTTVHVGGACAWTATTDSDWITLTAGSGTGDGTLSFSRTANTTGDYRFGSITIGPVVVYVYQDM